MNNHPHDLPLNAPSKVSIAPELIAPKGYLSFAEAKKFAVTLNLKTRKEWRQFIKGDLPQLPAKPANVPAHPDGIYKIKGWQGWKHWLGTVGAHE